MKALELVLGIVLVSVVLYYLMTGSQSNQIINTIGKQSSSFVCALMGRSC